MMQIQTYQVQDQEGKLIELEYDAEGDMLEIFFERRRASGAIELADPIILRFDRKTGQALSLSVLTFSKLMQPTQFGPVAFALTGIDRLPNSLKTTVLAMLLNPPINQFLKIVGYSPSSQQSPIPLSYMSKNRTLSQLSLLAA